MQKIKVLYVDDEANNLISFKALFRIYFDIYTASSATEAMRVLGSVEIHVVISDQRMPAVKGVDFLEVVYQIYPDTTRMLLTAFADAETIIQAVNKSHIYKCLSKPVDMEEVRESVEEGYHMWKRNREIKNLACRVNELTQTNMQLEFMLQGKLLSEKG